MRKPRQLYKYRLLRLAEVIKGDPEHFSMRDWIGRGDYKIFNRQAIEAIHGVQDEAWSTGRVKANNVLKVVSILRDEGIGGMPWCGSVLCLAGRACYENPQVLRGLRSKKVSWTELGAKVLGLDEGTAARLFRELHWPEWAHSELRKGDSRFKSHFPRTKVLAKVAARLLEMLAEGEDPWDPKWEMVYDQKGWKGVNRGEVKVVNKRA